MKVAIIGCGKIGMKRARAFQEAGQDVVLFIDSNIALAARSSCIFNPTTWAGNYQTAADRKDIDIVCVATPHNLLAPITLAMVKAGKHVLVEKPGAIRSAEFDPIIGASEEKKVVVHVGYNHRFHPGIKRAKEICAGNGIGRITHIRACYGHGGRFGYEKEWRADKEISGGGELMDQGVHLIDLVQWFIGGEIIKCKADLKTFFWDMKVEDNAFITLQTTEGQIAQLHVSWTEWKNKFSFEVFGLRGKVEVRGLGRSYGPERVIHYRMYPDMKPPPCSLDEFAAEDVSWANEVWNFISRIKGPSRRHGPAQLYNAKQTLEVVEALYAHARLPQKRMKNDHYAQSTSDHFRRRWD